MERKDWLLISIASAWDEPVAAGILPKVLFRFSREALNSTERETFYVFETGGYGPTSEAIYLDCDELLKAKEICRTHVEGALPPSYYFPTPRGMRHAQELALSAPVKARQLLLLSQELHALGFRASIVDVYTRYPEFWGTGVFHGG